MVLRAVQGGLAFCSRLPLAHHERDWNAFRSTPIAFPVVGYVLGVLFAIPVGVALFLGVPAPVAAILYLGTVYLVTGLNHADGVVDLGDAAATQGSPRERRSAMKDTSIGAGGVLALALVVVGLGFGSLSVAGIGRGPGLGGPPTRTLFIAVGLIVAAEVGAKLGMATVATMATASHAGLGSEFTSRAGPAQLLGPLLVSLPAGLLTGRSVAALAAVAGGVLAALVLTWWSDDALDGVGGDVFGAANEIGRVVGLHLGVVGWFLI